LLLSPLRRLFENPQKLLGSFVRPGMIVLEPGSGMGYFTLPLARMVGPDGRVVAVEIQHKMLSVLTRRAHKAGLAERIELRHAKSDNLGVDDLAGRVDFAAALHLVHEVPDQLSFFTQIFNALKSGGRLLVIEPKHHVAQKEFGGSLHVAEEVGFAAQANPAETKGLSALLIK
jgi:ubiquinone/menaquinone biosynthesis C-methylase UbiE